MPHLEAEAKQRQKLSKGRGKKNDGPKKGTATLQEQKCHRDGAGVSVAENVNPDSDGSRLRMMLSITIETPNLAPLEFLHCPQDRSPRIASDASILATNL